VPLLTEVPKLLGIDGRKMSKSYNNAIYISDRGDELRAKIEAMFTDPQRMRKKDPGRPELCNVFTFHQIYSPAEFVKEVSVECKKAGIGCTECKRRLADRIAEGLRPIHERQDYFRQHLDEVRNVFEDGNVKAAREASVTMEEVREAIKI
jgi:tryptophanyl-tRNA synthetase